MASTNWPEWWFWELEISSHVLKRMVDRSFNEVDLRRMLEEAMGFRKDFVEGRYVVETRHDGRRWEVVIEPIADERTLLVITAYRVTQ